MIPFDHRVIFVNLLNCAESSSRFSEVAQPSTRSPGFSSWSVAEGSASCGFLARSESGVAPGEGRHPGASYQTVRNRFPNEVLPHRAWTPSVNRPLCAD
jgi:hypothetical protein